MLTLSCIKTFARPWTRRSVHASRILAAGTEAMTALGLKQSNLALHQWQLVNIAGKARVVHGSSPVFVGVGSDAVYHQQRRSEIVGTKALATTRSLCDRDKIARVVRLLRVQFKEDGLIVRVVESDNGDFSVILSSKTKIEVWADHVKGTKDGVDKQISLATSSTSF